MLAGFMFFVCFFYYLSHLRIPPWKFPESVIKIWLDLAEILLIYKIVYLFAYLFLFLLFEASCDTPIKISWKFKKYWTWFSWDISNLKNVYFIICFFVYFLFFHLNHVGITQVRFSESLIKIGLELVVILSI